MRRIAIAMCATIVAMSFVVPVSASDLRYRPIRYGITSGWLYDHRNDDRDFPTNGVFPGNFAAHPTFAWIGAAGFLESAPQRSVLPYPSQVVFGVADRLQRHSGSIQRRVRSARR